MILEQIYFKIGGILIYKILNNKEKCDVFYNNRAVWIQGISDTTAKVGFIDNNKELLIIILSFFI